MTDRIEGLGTQFPINHPITRLPGYQILFRGSLTVDDEPQVRRRRWLPGGLCHVHRLPGNSDVVVRALVSVDDATVNVAVPEPLPLAGLIEIQETADAVVHAQPAVVVIVTVAVPPTPAIVTLVGDTV